jgi:hypothetical protein
VCEREYAGFSLCHLPTNPQYVALRVMIHQFVGGDRKRKENVFLVVAASDLKVIHSPVWLLPSRLNRLTPKDTKRIELICWWVVNQEVVLTFSFSFFSSQPRSKDKDTRNWPWLNKKKRRDKRKCVCVLSIGAKRETSVTFTLSPNPRNTHTRERYHLSLLIGR